MMSSSTHDAPMVSVVVPTYSRSHELRRLLDSFERLKTNRPFEVIVVDDASPDDTEQVLADWASQPSFFEKRYFRLEANSGPAHARNRGTEEARGEYVIYTDSDCVVEPDWFTQLSNPAQFRDRIAGVGGRVVPLDPDGLIGRYNSFHNILEPPDTGLYLVTCNCCLVRQLVIDVGGFDEDIPHPGGEDVALCIKLWLKGYRFGKQPKAVLYHDYRENLDNFKRTWFNYGDGTGFSTERYLPPEFADPRTYNHRDISKGWQGNPLHPAHLGPRLRLLLIWFRLGRRRRIHFMDSIRFVYLGFVHVTHYRRGWAEGVARAKALKAAGRGTPRES